MASSLFQTYMSGTDYDTYDRRKRCKKGFQKGLSEEGIPFCRHKSHTSRRRCKVGTRRSRITGRCMKKGTQKAFRQLMREVRKK